MKQQPVRSWDGHAVTDTQVRAFSVSAPQMVAALGPPSVKGKAKQRSTAASVSGTQEANEPEIAPEDDPDDEPEDDPEEEPDEDPDEEPEDEPPSPWLPELPGDELDEQPQAKPATAATAAKKRV
jgi:hypothetical protein